MKQLLLTGLLAFVLGACNDAAKSTEDAQDSLDSLAKVQKERIDSTAEERMNKIDSTTEAKKEALEKRDSADDDRKDDNNR